MYRILETSDKESINSEKLYEFIHESIEKRFTLFRFVDLRQLKDEKWEQIYREWKSQKDNQYNIYYEYLGINFNYLEYIMKLKSNISKIKKENKQIIQENEEIIQENEENKKKDKEIKKENEEIKKENEENKKEDEEIKKENEKIMQGNEIVNKENEDIKKEDGEHKKEDEIINIENEKVKNKNEEVKKENKDAKKEDEKINEENGEIIKEEEKIKKENEEVKSSIPQIYLDFYHSNFFQEMKENSSKIEKEMECIINQLQETVQQENHDKEVEYKQLLEEKQKEYKNRMKQNMYKSINSYNEQISFLILNKCKSINEFSIIGCKLNEYLILLSDLIKVSNFSNDPIILYQPEWPDHSMQLKLILENKCKSKKSPKQKTQHILLDPMKKKNYYFPISIINSVLQIESIFKYNNSNSQTCSPNYDKLTWKEVKYYPIIIDENKINDVVQNNLPKFKGSPILIFGSSLDGQKFIQKLDSTKNLFTSLVNDIENDILNEKIPDTSFSKTKKIISVYVEILSLLKVQFSDASQCPTVQNSLDELKQIYGLFQTYATNIESFYQKNKLI